MTSAAVLRIPELFRLPATTWADEFKAEMRASAEAHKAERWFFWRRVFAIEDAFRRWGVQCSRDKSLIQVVGRHHGAAEISFGWSFLDGWGGPRTCLILISVFDRPESDEGSQQVARYQLEHVDHEFWNAARWLASRFARRPVDPGEMPMACADFPKPITQRAHDLYQRVERSWSR